MAVAAGLPSTDTLKRIAPRLAAITEDLLFGEIWERPGLSKRERSMITIAALVALNRPDQLRRHISRGLGNGITREELIELLTHLVFYAGWPAGTGAIDIAAQIFDSEVQ